MKHGRVLDPAPAERNGSAHGRHDSEPAGSTDRHRDANRTLLLVDDCRLSREFLADCLLAQGIWVDTAHDSRTMVDQLRKHSYHLILVHSDCRDMGRILTTIANHDRALRTIVSGLSEDDEESIAACAEAGILGFHLRNESLTELLSLIGGDGELVCSPGVSAILLRRLSSLLTTRKATGDVAVLTVREEEILSMLEQGMSNREISERLFIAVHTVKNHVHNILNKTGARSRAEAVAMARRSASLRPITLRTSQRGDLAGHHRG